MLYNLAIMTISGIYQAETRLPPASYQALVDKFREIGKIEADLEMHKVKRRTATYAPGTEANLDAAISALALMAETHLRNPAIVDLLAQAAADYEDLTPDEQRMVTAIREDLALKTALPVTMAVEAKEIETRGRSIHASAQKANDWAQAAPWLEQVIAHQRQADALYRAQLGLDEAAGNGMLAVWSPGFSVAQVDAYFSALRDGLTPLVDEAVTRQARQPAPEPLAGPFPADGQKALNKLMAVAMGMDMTRGGLEYSQNAPIEGGIRTDARANLREPDENDPFYKALKSAIHEVWHEIYIQNLPEEYDFLPLGQDLGGVMQESQALLGEMIIGRTRAFSALAARSASDIFSRPVDADQLYRLRSQVTPTHDRKDADELTYHLHVIARWEAYKELLAGEIGVDDYPQRLAALYKEIVGFEIDDPVRLALADVHLFVGKGALYPSYTLGHGIAAQLWDTLQRVVDDIDGKIGRGDFTAIKDWLADNIYQRGRLDDLHDLVTRTTGKTLDPDAQLRHLRDRFAPGCEVPAAPAAAPSVR